MKKELVDYKFSLISKDEYHYTLFVVAKDGLIKNQFIKATAKLKRIGTTDKKANNTDYDNLKGGRYMVPKNLYKLAQLNARGLMEDVKKQVGADGIKLVTEEIKDMYFFNDGETDKWTLEVNVKGLYHDER